MTRFALALAPLLLSLAGSPAAAQVWVPMGPPGGDVRSLASDPRQPSRLYLGTADGVLYRSEDSGQGWQRLAPGFPERGQSLDDIVVDASGTVWVGYWEVRGTGGGVARSNDGGRTFTLLPGIQGHAVRALAQSAAYPNVLVAGTLTGVFRTVDEGRTWRRISPEGHVDLKNVGSLAIDPQDAGVIYAGTWHLPWKTTDAGRTWYPISKGIIDDSDIMTLTLDRRSPRLLYATACSGIYRSSDAAGRWAKVRGIPSSSRRTRAFAQSPDDPNVLYAGTTEGLWISRDGGTTWTLATGKDVVVNAVVALPGGTVLLGCDGLGVLRSDGGQGWLASNRGFSERFVSRLAFDGVRKRVLAGIWGDRKHGGVFFAPLPAGPWERLAGGLEGREVLSLTTAGPKVLAGTDDGVFLWSGDAAGWKRLPTQLGRTDLHPRVNDVAAVSEKAYLVGTSVGLLRTLDGGLTWKRPILGAATGVHAVAASPRNPSVALAATALGFFQTQDGGERWTLVASALPATPHGMAFLPGSDSVLFATTGRGLYRSDDQGRTWLRTAGGVPHTDITGLALHPDGRTAYATDFTTGGIFRSQDGGLTWRRLPKEGLLTERAWAVGVDPAAPERVFISSPAGGLHLLQHAGVEGVAAGSPE
jgi:photosystem II stability/assembly factor-like uncharacterized protein